MNHPGLVPKSARLFDELCLQPEVSSRRPLGEVSQNRGDNARSSTRRRHRRCQITAVTDDDNESSPDLWLTPKEQKSRKKKGVKFLDEDKQRTKKQKDKKITGKAPQSKNYPNCTKDSLLRAFEQANLPDFDAIAQYELNITVERPGRKRCTPVPSPRMSDVLRVFEETDQLSDPRPAPEQQSHRMTRSSQKLIVGTPLEIITLTQNKFQRRRKHAELIEPILLNLTPELDERRSSSIISESMSSVPDRPASTETADHLKQDSSSSRTMLQGRCTTRISNPSPVFAVPAAPTPISLRGHVRSFLEPHTLREDAFGQSFGAGMTSTPITARKRGFLKPHTRPPVFPSASKSHVRAASVEPFQLRSSLALSTGWASRRNISLVMSQLQKAGKSHRMISCASTHLNETVVADRGELRDTLVTSFSTAFSTARLVAENGDEMLLTPRDKVLALCSPQVVTPFSSIFTQDFMQNIHKIGEGSFGEIFLVKGADGMDLICKLVPFNIHEEEDGIFAQILPEVMILSTFNRLRDGCLNQTPNFISMSRAAILKGSFPQKLLDEWDMFDKLKQSENPDPRIYNEDNMHLLMVLNHGGTDLEHFKLKSADQALGIFLQTAFSLAAAESEFEFEHRDLHWGNILVRDSQMDVVEYVVTGCPYEVPSGRVEVSIIDFTLSRISKDGCTVYDDLSKYSDIFTGDASEDYQFEVYRLMQQENGNDWSKFCPKTNILWLNYLLDKLLTRMKYTSRSKIHQKAVESLRKLRKNILAFACSKDLVESSFMNEMLQSWR